MFHSMSDSIPMFNSSISLRPSLKGGRLPGHLTHTQVGVAAHIEPHPSPATPTGQPVDGPQNGPAPGPWDIAAQPSEMFKDEVKVFEVSHTASVKPCHGCLGVGMIQCRRCLGGGQVECFY